ncbi:MAG: hypothetical protein AAFY15_13805, partial [Cyanobacteria bacterium J06648_11]
WHFLPEDRVGTTLSAHGYEEVVLEDVVPGVDWIWMEDAQGHPRFDFAVDPGVALDSLRLQVEGGALRVGADGAVSVTSSVGETRCSAPVAIDGGEVCCDARWVNLGDGKLGLEAPSWTGERPLRIDPSIVYSTFIGALSVDIVEAVQATPSGANLLAGRTFSTSFPTTPGVVDPVPMQSEADVFVLRLSVDGSNLEYSTFLGQPEPIEFEKENVLLATVGEDPVIVHRGSSSQPATPGAFSPVYPNTSPDVFVVRLNASATEFRYVANFGGSDFDYPEAVSVTSGGAVRVAGSGFENDYDPTFVVTGDPGPTFYADNPAFVFELSADGSSLNALVEIGGGGGEALASALLTLPNGDLIVGGFISLNAFTVTSDAFQPHSASPLTGFPELD